MEACINIIAYICDKGLQVSTVININEMFVIKKLFVGSIYRSYHAIMLYFAWTTFILAA